MRRMDRAAPDRGRVQAEPATAEELARDALVRARAGGPGSDPSGRIEEIVSVRRGRGRGREDVGSVVVQTSAAEKDFDR
jgi:hypothetical protein